MVSQTHQLRCKQTITIDDFTTGCYGYSHTVDHGVISFCLLKGPSAHRIQIVFLWFTTCQFIFAIIISGSNQDLEKAHNSDMAVIFIGTLIVSIIFSYIYAGIALCFTKAAPVFLL